MAEEAPFLDGPRFLKFPAPASADRCTLSVRDVIEAFLADRTLRSKAGKLNSKVLDRYVARCSSFAVDFGDCEAALITDNDLSRWLIGHPEWVSGYTIEDAAGAVVTCFRWADKQWPQERLPRLKRPADLIPGKPVRRPLFEDEFRAIMKASRRGHFHRLSRVCFRAAMLFLWRTGARTCEMREVLFSDVQWDQAHIILPPERHKTGKKTREARIIPLDSVALSLVRRLYRHRRRGQAHIFVNGRGRQYTCQIFADMFRLLANQCSVPETVSAYCTRHAFACRGRRAGFSNEDVADVLGNDPRTVRKHYDAWERQQPGHLAGIVKGINGKRMGARHD